MVWAIRVVWISFRPSEPETWVRILHRPLNLHIIAESFATKVEQNLRPMFRFDPMTDLLVSGRLG